jgi:hypothetical protein
MERERVDPNFSTTPNAVGPDDWDAVFDKLWRLRDTSDFDLLYLLNALYVNTLSDPPGHPMIDAGLWAKAEQAVVSFKYWYSDPTPVRLVDGNQVVDDMWYWSENHVLLFHTNEYLAGKLFPDATFAVTGQTGSWHMNRARASILEWFDERARWGFNEWHSNVYYILDMTPLLSLVEWSEDPELETRAAMMLDLLFLDIALHLHQGTFGATHGRSYAKDKASADTENTFQVSRLFFEDTALPYVSTSGSGATLFARARNYRLPEVIRRIARNDAPMVDRERMNLPVDERPPVDANTPIPDAPYGLDFRDENRVGLWWSMGLMTTWVGLPLFLEIAEREDLWQSDFFAPFYTIVAPYLIPGDPEASAVALRSLLTLAWRIADFGVLKEVHTYTYRTGDYMLSAALDHRKGNRSQQVHSWQATLGERAMVFTNHPGYYPVPLDAKSVPEDWNWQHEDEPGPGYWTGEASHPRSAQHLNVGIHIYAPQYSASFGSFLGMSYVDETHAYFPHAHFDEVVQDGKWTFGRYGEGYVALYSYHDTEWRDGQPELFQNGGLPFDLVAAGSKDNVWIVECGSESEWGSFGAFRSAIAAASVLVTELGTHGTDAPSGGFDVIYESPSRGSLSFGWEAPFTVNGVEVDLANTLRYQNPFVWSEFNSQRYEISEGQYGLTLDFSEGAGTRVATGTSAPIPTVPLWGLIAAALLLLALGTHTLSRHS